ncbi:hypothetical protein CLH_2920 [Clostridium botulinum E3 str. Alaska E43]|nr:hypothetical protein CLH_2920 [Clostridium botulinum E3 str. Alaska E43]
MESLCINFKIKGINKNRFSKNINIIYINLKYGGLGFNEK